MRLIADENVLEVKRQFEELLDRISPFYQDRIKDLPPQERAVLETMALIRTLPKTPALIAKKAPQVPPADLVVTQTAHEIRIPRGHGPPGRQAVEVLPYQGGLLRSPG